MMIRRTVMVAGFLTVLLFSFAAHAQYITNGSASQNNCNCYTLTQQVNTQSGSVWNSNKIDLTNSFDFHFNVYLGCQDANGADGIVFILQPISTTVGTTGSGMGFQGVSPSVGIALDTWQNNDLADPAYDHISIQTNGQINHNAATGNLTSPVSISATSDNVEDCQWHVLRITWNATTKTITAYFDGVQRVQVTYDLVANIFSGNPSVYWGFTGATGGSTNLQQFCTALNPQFTTNFSGDATCIGTPMLFQDNSESFTIIQSYYWDFGDNTTSTVANPPPHLYTTPGPYVVKHVISGADGCISDTMRKTIRIGAIPVADFSVFDTCFNKPVRIINNSSCAYGTINFWEWTLDGNIFSTVQNPVLPPLATGSHTLQLKVQSEYGCGPVTVAHSFNIRPTPQINFTTANGCVNVPVNFTATQTDNQTSIAQWNWNFGDGNTSTVQNPSHTYNAPQQPYNLSVFAIATNGCSSDTLHPASTIGATPVPAFEVRDTCEGKTPFFNNQTTINGGTVAQWNWLLNNQPLSTANNPDLSSLPAGNYQLQLTATGNTGCVAAPLSHSFVIKNIPVVSASGLSGCFNVPTNFSASQTDNQTTISQWTWNFGDGITSSLQNPVHTYTNGGTFNASVTATASNGCASNAVPVTISINKLSAFAGNDTTVIQNVPFVLKPVVSSTVSNTLTYQWSPVTGLNDATLLQPTSTLAGVDSIIYALTVTSADGCSASDNVRIKVFNGVAIYVPKGFTPDGNGLNDILRPVYAGITGLKYFAVYNRWGQLVFKTSSMGDGWDGTINGTKQNTGVFVWIISALDYTGKPIQLRGITTLIH